MYASHVDQARSIRGASALGAMACVAGVFLAITILAGCGVDELPLEPQIETPAAALGGTVGPQVPGGRHTPMVAGQLVARVGLGHTIEEIHATFGTSTIQQLGSTDYYLVATPAGAPETEIATAMQATLLCEVAEPNFLLQTAETERYSIAFYEGTFTFSDYADQDALERIGSPEAHLLSTGAGVRVAVLDTGIDLDHPALAGAIGNGHDFVDDDAIPEDEPNSIDEDGDGFIDEAAGHGTHVAGIVVAVAPDATVLPYRVLNSDGLGTAFDVAAAIDRAVSDGAQVINLSLGLDERAEVMREAIRDAADAGVLVVASAGNRGIEDRYHFPASENNSVMAITATDGADTKAAFASFGSHVDLAAPGAGIMSTYWNGGYALWSGTSMAAPFAAGAAALALAIDPALGTDVQALIENTSFGLDDIGHMWNGKIGEGRVQLDALVCELIPGCNAGVMPQPVRAHWH